MKNQRPQQSNFTFRVSPMHDDGMCYMTINYVNGDERITTEYRLSKSDRDGLLKCLQRIEQLSGSTP